MPRLTLAESRELALDEAERDLYRAARECTDAMRSLPGVNDEEIRARRALLEAARRFVGAELLFGADR